MSRSPLRVADEMLVTGPNGGGVAYLYGDIVLPLLMQSAAGLEVQGGRLAWCAQEGGACSTIHSVEPGRYVSHRLSEDDLDLHDILLDGDVWRVASTSRNAILTYDQEWRSIGEVVFDGQPDSNHLNCLVRHNDRLLASMFGRFTDHRGYKGRTAGSGVLVDVATGEEVLRGLSQPHSLQSVDGSLYYCDSETRRVVRQLPDGRCQYAILPGYTRGLHVGVAHVYVGLSKSRNAEDDTGIARFESATIAVLKREDFSLVGQVPLPWPEIYDIRGVHRHPALSSLFALAMRERGEMLASLEARHADAIAEASRYRADSDRALAHVRGEALGYAGRLDQERQQRMRDLAFAKAEADQALAEQSRQFEFRLAEQAALADEQSRQFEFRLAEAHAAHAELDEIHSRVIASRSWQLTRPLRLLARMVRHRGLGVEDRTRLRLLLRRWGLGSQAPFPVPVVSQRPRNQLIEMSPVLAAISPVDQGSRPDVYIWAVIDWHFRMQRPQHIARSLAEAGHRVFYISNTFLDSLEPGFKVEPLDQDGRLFQIHMHLAGAPKIYAALPDAGQCVQLSAGLDAMRDWAGLHRAVSLVQHPFWTVLAERLPSSILVYDCMDHHAGFGDNSPAVSIEEKRLAERSDLIVCTSQWLQDKFMSQGLDAALVRNAGDPAHFTPMPPKPFRDPHGRPVIGYVGAIAEWFDVELVQAVAQALPDIAVVLVGHDSVGASHALAGLENVTFTGEVPYAELPYWVHGFDVCLLPFRIMPLTLATNPVKVYEYLAAGKAVVATALPEMAQFGQLVEVADDVASFIKAVRAAIAAARGGDTQKDIAARQAFAGSQTWRHRADELDAILATLRPPLASVIVVTYNNLALTQACLDSLDAATGRRQMEIIVVDNASSDGTPGYLRAWADAAGNRKVILNPDNRGFAAANNQGLQAAKGEYLILLNNDTEVTPGWLRALISAVRPGSGIGLAGPATDNIGNEAKVEMDTARYGSLSMAALAHAAAHRGALLPMSTLAFFCVAMHRGTYESLGGLDESFGTGFFEDDDYCRRVEAAGLKCVCVEDAFVHHHLSASFDAMDQERRKQLFERNRAIYEAKWGAWEPHRYRP